MLTKTRRELAPEVKREAGALLASSGRPLTRVAAGLGIQPSMVRNWRAVQNGGAPRSRSTGADVAPTAAAAPSGPSPADQTAEVARLRRELAPCHPQAQGKIERWHTTLKNVILLENSCLPGGLEAPVAAFVEHCNHRRHHERLNNLTPADVYFGRGQTTLRERQRSKRPTMRQRRLLHQTQAA